jgi:hypothetical protein
VSFPDLFLSEKDALDTKTLRVVVGEDVSGHSLRGENLKNPKHEVVFWTPEYDVVGKKCVLGTRYEKKKNRGVFWAPEHVEV